MQNYQDPDNDSNIARTEIKEDSLIVEFKPGEVYEYTKESAGSNLEEMKRLAEKGDGLNAYLNKHKPGYNNKR